MLLVVFSTWTLSHLLICKSRTIIIIIIILIAPVESEGLAKLKAQKLVSIHSLRCPQTSSPTVLTIQRFSHHFSRSLCHTCGYLWGAHPCILPQHFKIQDNAKGIQHTNNLIKRGKEYRLAGKQDIEQRRRIDQGRREDSGCWASRVTGGREN